MIKNMSLRNSRSWFLSLSKERVLLLLILQMFIAGKALAQSDDFGLDFGLEAEKKLAPGLKLSLEGGVRTQDNTKSIDRYTLGLGLTYKFFSTANKKFELKANAGFDYLWTHKLSQTTLKENFVIADQQEIHEYNHTQSYWRNRYRTSLGLTANYTPNKRWSFQLKETVQHNHYCNKDTIAVEKWRFNDDDELFLKRIDNDGPKTAKDKFVLRNKLTVTYDIKKCKLDPFLSIDYGIGLNYSANKWKYTAGADYKLTRQGKLTAFYRYNHEDDDEEPNGHLVGFGYSFAF